MSGKVSIEKCSKIARKVILHPDNKRIAVLRYRPTKLQRKIKKLTNT